MKSKVIISLLVLLAITILLYFGICEFDLPAYLIGICCILLFLVVSWKQEHTYKKLSNLMVDDEMVDNEKK